MLKNFLDAINSPGLVQVDMLHEKKTVVSVCWCKTDFTKRNKI
jgi:hypothetical protein